MDLFLILVVPELFDNTMITLVLKQKYAMNFTSRHLRRLRIGSDYSSREILGSLAMITISAAPYRVQK